MKRTYSKVGAAYETKSKKQRAAVPRVQQTLLKKKKAKKSRVSTRLVPGIFSPEKKTVTVGTCAIFYAAGGNAASLMTFGMNSGYQPWGNYGAGVYAATCGTPTYTTNGWDGLARWINSDGKTAMYQNYRPIEAEIEISCLTENNVDAVVVASQMYGSYEGSTANAPASVVASMNDRDNRFMAICGSDGPKTIRHRVNFAEFFGLTAAEYKAQPKFQALSGAAPSNVCACYINWSTTDGVNLVEKLTFIIRVVMKMELFNCSDTNAATVIV